MEQGGISHPVGIQMALELDICSLTHICPEHSALIWWTLPCDLMMQLSLFQNIKVSTSKSNQLRLQQNNMMTAHMKDRWERRN